jgi:hypothetical protein
MAQVVEYLHNKCETLSSNSSTAKKKINTWLKTLVHSQHLPTHTKLTHMDARKNLFYPNL